MTGMTLRGRTPYVCARLFIPRCIETGLRVKLPNLIGQCLLHSSCIQSLCNYSNSNQWKWRLISLTFCFEVSEMKLHLIVFGAWEGWSGGRRLGNSLGRVSCVPLGVLWALRLSQQQAGSILSFTMSCFTNSQHFGWQQNRQQVPINQFKLSLPATMLQKI